MFQYQKPVSSQSTPLNGRTLRYDGVSVISPEEVAAALLRGVPPSKLLVTELDEDLVTFNANVSAEDELKIDGGGTVQLDLTWQLPPEFLKLDLEGHVLKLWAFGSTALHGTYTPEQLEVAAQRVCDELDEIKRRGMTEFFKTVIYVLHVFRANGVVWGVGRGSSCASYILFLLGLHSVDCVRYQVPMEEFYHD